MAVSSLLLAAGTLLRAETLRVPADYPTIKSAVNRAADGDTILVDDGVYLEKNIEVAKDILIKSKNLYGAVIYGAMGEREAIFIMRAAARIEGFVLKRSGIGIEQRNSPDVRWQAADLVLFNCSIGLSVNDAASNVGSAAIRNVVVFGYQESVGVSTNDARSVDVSGSLFLNCRIGFQGYDHLSFRVRDSAALDCGKVVLEDTGYRPIPPASNRVEMGKGFRELTSAGLRDPRRFGEFQAFLRASIFRTDRAERTYAVDETAAAAVIALVRGEIYSAIGDHVSAARSYEEARSAAERAGSRELGWQALISLAGLGAPDQERGKAVERYKEAIGHLERWIPEIPVGIYRINFLEDKTPAFETLIGLLLDGHREDPTKGHDEQAFYYSEKMKSLSRLFPLRPNGARGGADPRRAPRAPDKAAAGRNIALAQLKLQDPDLAAQEKDRLISLLERAEEDYHGKLIEEERSGRGSRAAEGEGPASSPFDCRGIRNRLNGRALVSYVLGAKESFAFLATETGLECARLPAAPTISGMLEPYLRFLQLPDGKDFRAAKAGRILFDTLLGRFVDKLPPAPARLIIVPDGRLNYLPFEALVKSGGDRGGRAKFWTECAEISYASSATQALADGPLKAAGGPPANVLAVGNSGGIRCDNRLKGLKRFYFPLAHVKKEIRTLTRYFPRRNVVTLIDEEAGERQFKAAGLARYGIIHLAAHGVIEDADWWRSALLLTPDREGVEDGFLTALEISELELDAGLVVLSGCGTGGGSLFKGEGIKGLSGAFLRAGAKNLLVSLWNVDDRATAAFMGNFYKLLAAGSPPARALARTKLWMIGSGYRNPFYWAPFVLIGKADGEDGAERAEGPLIR